MSSAAPSHVLPPTRHGPHGLYGLPTQANEVLRRPSPSKPADPAAVSATAPGTAETETHEAYPQVPPESPLPMHARAFDFVGMRDLFGRLGQGRRHRSPPALTAAPPSAAPHG